MVLNKVHRALGPRSTDPNRPLDVVCQLHRYPQKELIIRKAWERGGVDFDDAPIRILTDLSRMTLQRRACLHPILDLAREQGAMYRWGYPLAVAFRKASASFTLCMPADLPELFTFLDVEPIQVPNWFQLLPNLIGCPGSSGPWGPPQTRQQRS